MKKIVFGLIILFGLFINQINAKSIYYVKAGANGDGSSWSNASGDIQGMIDKASNGDEIWIAKGTYYPPEPSSSWKEKSFKLKMGVSLYGGFAGNERSVSERKKQDRDGNGKIDSWEFVNETILSGENGVEDVWQYDEEDRLLGVSGLEDNSYVLEYDPDNPKEIGEIYLSGLSLKNGIYGLCIESQVYNYDEDCNIILESCDISQNEIGISGEGIVSIFNSNIYHNSNKGLSWLKTAKCCDIHHNKTGISGSGSLTYPHSYYISVDSCEVYYNGSDEFAGNGGVDAGIIKNSKIYNNIGSFGGNANAEMYNCEIYNNKSLNAGGGVYNGNLYNCLIYDNLALGSGGGLMTGRACFCQIYGNETLSDGGGFYNTAVYNCSIYNNRAEGKGGGCADGIYIYNCDIYNNQASSYGGVYSDVTFYTIYNSTVVHNKSLSGNGNSGGGIFNTIMEGSYEGYATNSILTDSYISGAGNFLAAEKELKFVKPTSFSGIATNDAQLKELQNADFSLAPGSVAIDRGKTSQTLDVPTEDVKGLPRVMGNGIDIGAHEYLTYFSLPYKNNFEESSYSMPAFGSWHIDQLPGKYNTYLYCDASWDYDFMGVNYVTTPFFEKSPSTQINLSFDFTSKYKTTDQKEMMHVILAYEDSNNRDTIATYRNTAYTLDSHFSKEISQWVRNKVFRVIFAVEGVGYNNNNIDYAGITNLSITKQDGSVEISAKDAIVTYDGKPHAITYQINDERVDKSKVVVSYQKEGEDATSTPPVNAGVYAVTISVNDGELAGIKEVKLTIEKAYQNIVWEQTLGILNALDRIQLKATSTSGLPVEFESDDETIAKVEKVGEEWWLVADTLDGEATIRAFQLGNENYNLANSLLKTVRVKAPEEVVTGIDGISNAEIKVYYVKSGNYIQIDNAAPGSMYYLYNSLGRLTASGDIQSLNWKVQTYREESGLYYLLIVNKDGKESFKVLINK